MMDAIFTKESALQFELGVVLIKENNIFVAYIPALDLSTHGDSEQDAIQAAQEAANAFLSELHRMGTFEEVLLDLGWRKDGESLPFIPPEIIHSSKISCHA